MPCRRVVAEDGSLGGFTPDILIKKELLKLEAEHKASFEKSGT
ncbi:MAG TPA: MGMT family protein [Methanocorpusculum sp.]|nr:MGMT family protein [Methanocorpusculum sp.]